jgi:hypothetical protein
MGDTQAAAKRSIIIIGRNVDRLRIMAGSPKFQGLFGFKGSRLPVQVEPQYVISLR